MEIDLMEAYDLTRIDRKQLNEKQIQYLDKIFRIAIKFSIISEEPLEILALDLREIAQDIKEDPIFLSYSLEEESDFSEYDPTHASIH